MATTSTFVLGFMDFIFASDLIGEGENYLVSDAENGEDLQFQEDLLSSAITSQLIINIIPELLETTNEAGESSQSFCEICLERKDKDQMFTIGSCFHSFCSDCISQHVITRIQQSRTTITCPEVNCKSVLELDAFRHLLAKEVIIRWKDALCEEFIRPLPKFYCPFEDCSAMFVVDSEGGDIRQSECQFCHRMFCAKCRVPWHPGVGCEEYKELNQRNRDDLMLRKLAKEKNWGWCPQCKVYVERTDGCPHMTCRCKFQFCYRCGEEWTKDHGGCERN